MPRNPHRSEFLVPSIQGQSICPYFLPLLQTFTPPELSVFFSSSLFPSLFSLLSYARSGSHPLAKDTTRLSLDCASAKLCLARTSSSWHGNHYHPFPPSVRGSLRREWRIRRRRERGLSFSFLFLILLSFLLAVAAEIEKAKEDEEWECEEENIIHRGLLPPYRNTPGP